MYYSIIELIHSNEKPTVLDDPVSRIPPGSYLHKSVLQGRLAPW